MRHGADRDGVPFARQTATPGNASHLKSCRRAFYRQIEILERTEY